MKYDLTRFKTAQDKCYSEVVKEMKIGSKKTHWMWYIFPQITGLGKSVIARQYEIQNLEEAEAYLLDDTLGKRLIELTRILTNEVNGKSAEEIFGFPDYLKFRSSMTLFNEVVKANNSLNNNPEYKCFEDALKKYYKGQADSFTLNILEDQV